MTRTTWLLTTLAVVLCFGTMPVMADDVFFSDFGPGFSYYSGAGWTVSGASTAPGEYTAANLFTAAISGSVGQIDVALSRNGGDGTAAVSLWTNNNGLPGTPLGAWGVTSLQDFGGCCGVVTISGIAGVNLTAGESYFMMIATGEPSNWNVWNFNDQFVTGLDLFSQDQGLTWTSQPNGTLGAFDVRTASTAVPEPSTVVLFGTVMMGVIALRRRK
jgi:hypothetical protein